MPHGAPVTSVVMPVFNGVPWLADTVDSIASQRDVRTQLLAVDDGSSDGSAELLRRKGWRVLETARTGPNVARALALKHAEGEFVAMIDQDDLWHPDHLSLAVATLRSHPQVPAALGPRRMLYGNSPPPRLGTPRRGPSTFDPWAAYPVNIIEAPSMAVVRRAQLDAAGGWPCDRRLGADMLCWWRLSADTPFAIMPRRTVAVRRSAGSLSAVSRQRPIEYLSHLRSAAQDALASRREEERPHLRESAVSLLDAVSGLAAAILDGGNMTAQAEALEKSLSQSSEPMIITTVGLIGWLLEPYMNRAGCGGLDPIATIIDKWPPSAPRTRIAALRMVAAVAGARRLVGFALKAPLRPSRMVAAGMACAYATTVSCGRVSDPLGLQFPRRTSGHPPMAKP